MQVLPHSCKRKQGRLDSSDPFGLPGLGSACNLSGPPGLGSSAFSRENADLSGFTSLGLAKSLSSKSGITLAASHSWNLAVLHGSSASGR